MPPPRSATQAPPGGLQQVKSEVAKGVKLFNDNVNIKTLPDITLKLRKKYDVGPVRFTAGIKSRVWNGDGSKVTPKPQLSFAAHDRILKGKFRLEQDTKTITYTKKLNIGLLKIGVDGSYNIPSKTPFLSFTVKTTAGVVSPVQANGISLNQSLEGVWRNPDVDLKLLASVDLPEAKFNNDTSAFEYGKFDLNMRMLDVVVTM